MATAEDVRMRQEKTGRILRQVKRVADALGENQRQLDQLLQDLQRQEAEGTR